jgi:hypothetical protein
LVGEAVSENSHQSKIITIGISSLSVVSFSEDLNNSQDKNNMKYKNSITYGLNKTSQNINTIPLDPNHTHFIFIDNNCRGELGHEVQFRTKLETDLRKTTPHIYNRLSLRDDISNFQKFHDNKENAVTAEISGDEFEVDKLNEKKYDLPLILIVVNGNYETLKQIQECLKRNAPILILAVKALF